MRTLLWLKALALILPVVVFGLIFLQLAVGDPITYAAPPEGVTGDVYFLRPLGGVVELVRQPANMRAEPIVVASRRGCPESDCDVISYWFEGAELFYVAEHQGRRYVWKGNEPIRPAGSTGRTYRNQGLPAGVSYDVKGRRILVDGKTALIYPGNPDLEQALWYYPKGWSPDGRYLIIFFPGYRSFRDQMLADVVQLTRPDFRPWASRHYLWDRETGRTYRWVQSPEVTWVAPGASHP